MFKKDFPIFQKNSDLVFLDSASTSQKPQYVLDSVYNFYSENYANIHRGVYDISKESEALYEQAKKKVADFLHSDDPREIIFTYNSSYAANLIAQSLKVSHKLQKGDRVLLSITEHHANLVPWLILKEEIGIEVEYISLTPNFQLDMDDFQKKYTPNTKIISLAYISNTTGEIYDLEAIGKAKRDDTIFIIDASQSIVHIENDVNKLNADFLFFTGHKIMAETGIAVIWSKKSFLDELKSPLGWGGSIAWVSEDSYKQALAPAKFEIGTPNLGGAVSLLSALEYIENIGGYDTIEKHESELVEYTLKKLSKIEKLSLVGGTNASSRVGVFTFFVEGIHANDIGDILAEENICIRAGTHCAEPFAKNLNQASTARMSLFLYNTKEDIDAFFAALDRAIHLLK